MAFLYGQFYSVPLRAKIARKGAASIAERKAENSLLKQIVGGAAV